jgi:hypothetical protein
MRAMWIATDTARRLSLGNDFFDRKPTHVTPPGAAFLRNSEQLYGLWFFAINNYREWLEREQGLEIGTPDENGLRSFQARASYGALKTTHYWLTVVLATLIEAYLKDGLAFMVLHDPAMHSLPGWEPREERNRASARRFSRRWMRSHKGPSRWLEGLQELGITGFVPDLAETLNEMLGVRHLVVHSAGVVDEEYLRHHPTSLWRLGAEAEIDEGMLRGFIQGAFDFFAPIEVQAVGRCLH